MIKFHLMTTINFDMSNKFIDRRYHLLCFNLLKFINCPTIENNNKNKLEDIIRNSKLFNLELSV